MIVVLCTFDVAPEDRDRFVSVRRETVERSRAEPGNIEYALSFDVEDRGRVRLTERWESREALDAHIAAIRNRGGAPDDPQTRARSVSIYNAEPAS